MPTEYGFLNLKVLRIQSEEDGKDKNLNSTRHLHSTGKILNQLEKESTQKLSSSGIEPATSHIMVSKDHLYTGQQTNGWNA